MYPELYPERTEYSEGNVWGPRLLEDWLEYQKSGSWYYGKDKNDDTDHTVLIISTHASIEEEDGDYWFRFLHQDNDREVDRTDRMTSEYQKCRTWWRNRNNWNRELIRMGSSSNSTSIGDGDTRWVIFHVCRSLQLTWDADEDYTVQDVWGWNDLSGGYRMIMGGSGHHHSNVGSAATTFVDRQYAQQWTFKQAWFDSMDGTFSTGSGQNDGRCVVYAKGGTTSAAQNTRDTDDFVYNINAAVPAASNQPDGWKSAWSSVNCENN